MKNASDVVNADLEHIRRNLKEELPELSGRSLLITGGAGFLGHYLVQAALHWNRPSGGKSPVHLTVYDNFSRGVPPWLDRLRGDRHLTLVKHDVTDPLPPDIGRFDYIIHAACIASPTYYRRVPIRTMDANVNGLRYILDYSREWQERGKGILGLLFFSTSEIYGDPTPENIPTPETYRGNVSCTGPRACYDESKRYGETLCVNFARYHDIPVKVARPFNNYGPGLKITDRRVLPDFARDVFDGRDIVMLSDGAPTRTFCYAADAIVGYFKILVKGRKGEAYNIGVEEPEISVADLADRVARLSAGLFGYKGRVVRNVSQDKDYLVDNPNRRCPVIAKAREDLGYAPSIGIDEGLKRSLLWYNENRRAEDA